LEFDFGGCQRIQRAIEPHPRSDQRTGIDDLTGQLRYRQQSLLLRGEDQFACRGEMTVQRAREVLRVPRVIEQIDRGTHPEADQ
jgi:hypothetical protein